MTPPKDDTAVRTGATSAGGRKRGVGADRKITGLDWEALEPLEMSGEHRMTGMITWESGNPAGVDK